MHWRLSSPVVASLDLTYKCNLECKTCNVWKITRPEKELGMSEWNDLVDQLIQAFSIRFFRLVGGEPFLHPGFKGIVHHIKGKGCKLGVVSNGTLIDKKMAHFLVYENVDRVRISINGLREIDDFYRGNGAFDKTVNAIKRLVREKRHQSAQYPKIEIHPFVSKVNQDEIVRLLHLSRQFQGDFNWHFMRGHIAEKGSRTEDPGFPKDPEKTSVMKLKERKDFEKSFSTLLSTRDRVLNVLYTRVARLPLLSDCPRATYHFLIDPWGYVFPCEHLYSYCYGNCRKQHVEEIWLSQRRSILRQYMKRGRLQLCHVCGRRRFTPPMNPSGLRWPKFLMQQILSFAYEEKALST